MVMGACALVNQQNINRAALIVAKDPANETVTMSLWYTAKIRIALSARNKLPLMVLCSAANRVKCRALVSVLRKDSAHGIRTAPRRVRRDVRTAAATAAHHV